MNRDFIMKEMDYANDVLNGGVMRFDEYTTTLAIAKYYKQHGLKDRELFNELLNFSKTYLKYDYRDAYGMATIISSKAGKSEIVDIDHIGISSSEMDVIQNVENFQARKLLFAMLCLAKYFDILEEKNNHWINAPMDKVIELANVRCKLSRVSDIMRDVYQSGIVSINKRFIKINNKVNFIDNKNELYKIYNMKDLGKQYTGLTSGKDVVFCERCNGAIYKNTPRARTKYCPSCAKIINREKSLSRYFASKYYPA